MQTLRTERWNVKEEDETEVSLRNSIFCFIEVWKVETEKVEEG